ncbi:MAG TPA: helix-turn-helix domain-containing protein [Sideroxyarcus sp.]|nr:helix-turn-helix domain-containing protein [Sideroxyarcus sp.]
MMKQKIHELARTNPVVSRFLTMHSTGVIEWQDMLEQLVVALAEVPPFDIPGACAYLHVTESELMRLIESGELPAVMSNKEYMIRKQSLEDYLIRLEIERTAMLNDR